MRRMHCPIIVLLVLMVAQCARPAVADEGAAFDELRSAFPSLSHVPLAHRITLDDVIPARWVGNLSSACTSDVGSPPFGLKCFAGRIASLQCDTQWAPDSVTQPLATPLPSLGGLTSLKEVTIVSSPKGAQIPRACYDLLEMLLSTPSIALEQVKVEKMPDSTRIALQSHSSLVSLDIEASSTGLPPMDFSNLPSLQTLSYASPSSQISSLTQLASLLPQVSNGLKVTIGPSQITSYSDINALGHVESLQIAGGTINGLFPALPTSLQSLTLVNTNIATLNMTPSTPGLRTLRLISPIGLSTIARLPSALTTFECHACSNLGSINPAQAIPSSLQFLEIHDSRLSKLPATLNDCADFSSLVLTSTSAASISLPTTLQATKIAVIRLEGLTIDDAALNSLVCQSLPKSRLQKLQLFALAGLSRLPSCLGGSAFPNLQHLEVADCTNISEATASALVNIVPRNVRFLSLSGVKFQGSSSGPLTALDWSARAPLLEYLKLSDMGLTGTFAWNKLPATLVSLRMPFNQLSGSLPPNFFELHGNLQHLGLESNLLSGLVPSYGLGKLETLNLPKNHFSGFPSIPTGAPSLRFINLDDNLLTTFPDDETFLAMPKLEKLSGNNNFDLRAPTPRFWALHPRLSSLSLNRCSFSGPLPDVIQTQRLRRVSLNGQAGQICGTLPELQAETAFIVFSIQHQRLTGSIPLSWQQYMTITDIGATSPGESALLLSHNLLSGTLPSPLLSPNSSPAVLDLSHNIGLHGNVSNFSETKIGLFNMFNTSLSVCDQSPQLAPDATTSCIFPFPGASCECSSSWSPCTESCTNPTPMAPSTAPPHDESNSPTYDQCYPPPPSAPVQEPLEEVVQNTDVIVSEPTTIVGDLILETASRLTFTGMYTLNVTGCISVSKVMVEVDEKTLEQIGKTKKGVDFKAITFGAGLCSETDTIPEVTIKQKKKSCEKANVGPKLTQTSLQLLLSNNKSQCQIWWIVLASVACGLVIIAVASVTLYLAFNEDTRRKFVRTIG